MAKKTPLYRLIQFLGYLFFRVFHFVSYRGERKLPEEGAVLVVSNHASHYDPVVASGLLWKRPLRFLAKEELFSGPKFFKWIIENLGAYPVKRGGSGDRDAYVNSIKILKDGGVLLVFPEGHRTPDGNIQEFAEGAARMAVSVPGIWIVPMRIKGSYEAFGSGQKFPKLGKRIVAVAGTPFRIEDEKDLPKERKALYRALTSLMFQRISQL
jgi:1-acyl-sn-glycerol-3-phosphate acyltransferase